MNRNPRGRRRQEQPVALPTITTAAGRTLVCYPASVFAFIVDSMDRFLLFRQPGETGWEVVSGELEDVQTVPDAAQRALELAAGPHFLATYLGVLDTFTFVFDANLPPLISICCLLRLKGGEIHPGADVRDAEFRWWALSDLDSIDLVAPRGRWDLLTKAVDMSRYLRDAREPEDEAPGDLLDFP